MAQQVISWAKKTRYIDRVREVGMMQWSAHVAKQVISVQFKDDYCFVAGPTNGNSRKIDVVRNEIIVL